MLIHVLRHGQVSAFILLRSWSTFCSVFEHFLPVKVVTPLAQVTAVRAPLMVVCLLLLLLLVLRCTSLFLSSRGRCLHLRSPTVSSAASSGLGSELPVGPLSSTVGV